MMSLHGWRWHPRQAEPKRHGRFSGKQIECRFSLPQHVLQVTCLSEEVAKHETVRVGEAGVPGVLFLQHHTTRRTIAKECVFLFRLISRGYRGSVQSCFEIISLKKERRQEKGEERTSPLPASSPLGRSGRLSLARDSRCRSCAVHAFRSRLPSSALAIGFYSQRAIMPLLLRQATF